MPYSSQSFHNVDKLIPVFRIECSEQAWEFAAQLHSLDLLVFEDQTRQERQLAEVLETTATRGLVVIQGGRLGAETYRQGYDGTIPLLILAFGAIAEAVS